MHILVCDDDAAFSAKVAEYAATYFEAHEIPVQATVCSDPEQVLAIPDLELYRIAFLDVDMPQVNGIALGGQLRHRNPDICLVYVSAYLAFALDGYKVNAYRYILKRDVAKQLPSCLEDIYASMMQAGTKTLTVHHNRENIRIPLDQIYYLESEGRVINVYGDIAREHFCTFYGKLKELPPILARNGFLQVGRSDVATVDVLSGMFPDKMQDFVLSINESDVAVVKQITANTPSEELEKIAQDIENTLKNELRIKTSIGIGTVSEHLRELADSYKEAQTAIEVGKVFDTEKSIMRYENLGIGRLIYQLPTTLCEIFLSEIFKKSSIDCLDQETLFTINKFFENNLNVSETSRKLFVHRNTLVYRLEKIKKLTGLDLRQFDHAIVFKVALMVRKYLSSREAR